MKKYLMTLVFCFGLLSVCFSQSITINSIGMHKNGEPGNFNVLPGDLVKVNVNYSTVDIDNIQGVYFGSGDLGQSKIIIFPYEGTSPSGSSTNSRTVSIDNFAGGELGTDMNTSFTFILPSLTNKASFQIALGLWGYDINWDNYSSVRHTSYLNMGPFTVTDLQASGNFRSYMSIAYDVQTLAPILTSPSSPTDATLDNHSLFVEFQLSEEALSRSVKLYFSPNSDGSSPTTTLTLANTYENTLNHQLELNAESFSLLSPHLIIVEGQTSLVHLNTYYVAIGYKDELGNAEAFSTWNKLVYDNSVDFPANFWPATYHSQTGTEITLTFNLHEATQGDLVLKINPHNSDGSYRAIRFAGYAFVPGTNSFTFRGDDFSASTNFAHLDDGIGYLSSGVNYRYQLIVIDLAGNIGTTQPSDPAIFYWDPAITFTAEISEADPNSSFNCGLINDYQNLAHLKMQTVSGSIQLNSFTFTVNPGSLDSDKISHIKVIDETNTFLRIIPYEGSKSYTISGINKIISSNCYNLYISFQIDYDDATFTSDEYISLSMEEEAINTTGTMINFTSNTAKKYLNHCLIVNHLNINPDFSSVGSETPFFRLDLNTNDGFTTLLNLVSFRIMGNITESDLAENKIHLWESSNHIFDATKSSLVYIQSKPKDSEITFNINRTISTNLKYYFFTIKVSATADPTHTIFGNIINSSDIMTSASTNISHSGFPLNDESILDDTLPVELSSFTSSFTLLNGVNLKWITESETNVSGYHLYRNESDLFDNALRINPLLITSSQENGTQKRYSYSDAEIEINTSYYYWLECLEYDGFSIFYGPYSVYTDEDVLEDELIINKPVSQLLSAYPNPFNPDVHIPYKLVENSAVEISIFNIKGQKVRTLINGSQEPGDYSVYFDGKDQQGNKLSSGIYLYKMKTNTYAKINKMILMK